MFQVICEFENVFGEELKSITDPLQIDAVMRKVEKLAFPIIEADFDIFDTQYILNWQELLNGFNKQVVVLEREAINSVDEAFKVLRYYKIFHFNIFPKEIHFMSKIMAFMFCPS